MNTIRQPLQPLNFEPPYRCLLRPARQLDVMLIGCGGTGSHLAQALGATLVHVAATTDSAVRTTFVDGDTVERKNVGRQRFCAAEIGRNKAETLAQRLNMAYGLKIRAIDDHLTVSRFERWRSQYGGAESRLLIGCVDNAAARQAMAEIVRRCHGQTWWLDCGNAEFNGQVLVGNRCFGQMQPPEIDLGLIADLPSPHWQEPGLLDAANDAEPAQDCALATARDEQSLMVNTLSAAIAAQYIYQWAVQRELVSMATYFNAQPPLMHSTTLTHSTLDPFWADAEADDDD